LWRNIPENGVGFQKRKRNAEISGCGFIPTFLSTLTFKNESTTIDFRIPLPILKSDAVFWNVPPQIEDATLKIKPVDLLHAIKLN